MANIGEMVSGSIFLTQERALKRVLQDRERGELAKARQHALEALEKWPNDYDLAMEAIQASLELSDYPQAANLLKNAHRRHGARRDEIMECARSAFSRSGSTLVGAFIVDVQLKARDFETIAHLAGSAPESFRSELLKRGEARSRNLASEGQERSALYGENALLLGVLYREAKQYEKSAEMLRAALELLPGDERPIGEALLRLESELPGSAAVKFYVALASLRLGHPDKAETRFFQCLERPSAPVEGILGALEAAPQSVPNGLLLVGEALIRARRFAEGASAIKSYMERGTAAGDGDAAVSSDERCRRVACRLAILPADVFAEGPVAFLYADAAAAIGQMKDAVAALETSLERDPGRANEVVAWLEPREAKAPSAPGQNLLARLYAASGRMEDAARAARLAADGDETAVPGLVQSIKALTAPPAERDPRLVMLLGELYARLGDRESAEESLGLLRRVGGLPEEDLMRLAGEIMRRCGVSLAGVATAIDIAMRRGAIDEALPHLAAYCRDGGGEHEPLAAELADLAGEDGERSRFLAGLLDAMAAGEELSPPLRFARAAAHLRIGDIERAVFEFDQLMMLDEGLRGKVIDLYRGAIARSGESAALHIALYHLYLDAQSPAEAARHLCRALEIEPGQIRDIMQRFDRLVELEPDNVAVWETMIATSLSVHRTNLAKEIMKRAVSALPIEAAAALHIHGARISVAEGAYEEALRCLEIALEAEQPDVRGIEVELRALVERDPGEPRAHFLLGQSLARLAREREAVAAFRRCLELSPDRRTLVKTTLQRLLPLSVEPWILAVLLGEIVWFEGNREEALRLFASAERGPRESLADFSASLDRVRAAAPEDGSLGLLHARILTLEERYGEASALLSSLLDRDRGLAPAASDVLQSIIAASPAQLDANVLLARLHLDAGDPARSRDALARLMADETADAARLATIVEPFLPAHGGDGAFLARYGALMARAGRHAEALTHLRAALERDGACADGVIAAIEGHRWPDETASAKTLLAVDCLTAAGRLDEAFSLVASFTAPDTILLGEIISRISALIARAPRREHFSLGASLLAGAGRLDEAQSRIDEGRRTLGGEDALDLTMELAEILHGAGETERAVSIFEEALAAAPDRSPVYARIERSYLAWADRMIAALSSRVAAAPAFSGATELLVGLLIDRGRAAEALETILWSAVPKATRALLLGRIYLAMDRPVLACAALAGAAGNDSLSPDMKLDTLYLEGIARERAGDHGRAAAVFAAAAAAGAPGDSHERSTRNYAAFIAESCEEPACAIVKTESI